MEEAKKETSSAAGDEDMHFTTNGNGRSLTIGTFNRIGERGEPYSSYFVRTCLLGF